MVTLRCETCGHEMLVHYDLPPPSDDVVCELRIRWRGQAPSADEVRRFRSVDFVARDTPVSELKSNLDGAVLVLGRFPRPFAKVLQDKYRGVGLEAELVEVSSERSSL